MADFRHIAIGVGVLAVLYLFKEHMQIKEDLNEMEKYIVETYHRVASNPHQRPATSSSVIPHEAPGPQRQTRMLSADSDDDDEGPTMFPKNPAAAMNQRPQSVSRNSPAHTRPVMRPSAPERSAGIGLPSSRNPAATAGGMKP